MVSFSRRLMPLFLLVMAIAARAGQVTLPAGNTAASTLTVHVSAQCRLSVPSAITFNVQDTTVDTHSSPAAVAVRGMVLAAPAQHVRLLLAAGAEQFTPPAPGAPTWAATDVRWGAPAWANGTGHPGDLSAQAFTEVAASNAGAASLSTDHLVFTLKANPSIVDAGTHLLQMVWKIESVTP